MRIRSKRVGAQYAAIPNQMMRNSDLSMDARGLLALLMGYSDDWQFYQAHLMETTGWGRDRLRKAVGELREAGYVEIVPTRNESGHMSGTTYVIHDDPTEALKTRSSAEALKSRASGIPSVGESTPIRKPDSKEIPTEEENQTLGDDDLFSETENKKPQNSTDVLFDQWWSLYPTRTGSNPKKAARAKFARAVKAIGFERLCEATRRFADSRKGEDPKFTPMASTWLNQDRWEEWQDEVKDSRHGLRRMNPDDPMEGIPETIAQCIRMELDPDERDRLAREYWVRQEAAE